MKKINDEYQELQLLFSTSSIFGVDLEQELKQCIINEKDFDFAKNIYLNRTKIKSFENPDLFIELNDEIIGIEMFEFDASSYNRKGSKLRQEEFKIDNNAKGHLVYKENIKTKFSLENYRQSLIKSFRHHYKNIAKYVEYLKEINKIDRSKIKICFIIHDVTPGNLVYKKNDETRYYMPLLDEVFVRELSQSTNLDYIISFHEEFYLHIPTFVSISRNNVELLNNNCIKKLSESDVSAFNVKRIVGYTPVE